MKILATVLVAIVSVSIWAAPKALRVHSNHERDAAKKEQQAQLEQAARQNRADNKKAVSDVSKDLGESLYIGCVNRAAELLNVLDIPDAERKYAEQKRRCRAQADYEVGPKKTGMAGCIEDQLAAWSYHNPSAALRRSARDLCEQRVK